LERIGSVNEIIQIIGVKKEPEMLDEHIVIDAISI